MSAVYSILNNLTGLGVTLGVGGDGGLVFEGPSWVLTRDLIASMGKCKAALIRELRNRAGGNGNTSEGNAGKMALPLPLALADLPADAAAELQYLFDEQAGRLEFDSGYSRTDAERLALAMLPRIVADLARGAA